MLDALIRRLHPAPGEISAEVGEDLLAQTSKRGLYGLRLQAATTSDAVQIQKAIEGQATLAHAVAHNPNLTSDQAQQLCRRAEDGDPRLVMALLRARTDIGTHLSPDGVAFAHLSRRATKDGGTVLAHTLMRMETSQYEALSGIKSEAAQYFLRAAHDIALRDLYQCRSMHSMRPSVLAKVLRKVPAGTAFRWTHMTPGLLEATRVLAPFDASAIHDFCLLEGAADTSFGTNPTHHCSKERVSEAAAAAIAAGAPANLRGLHALAALTLPTLLQIAVAHPTLVNEIVYHFPDARRAVAGDPLRYPRPLLRAAVEYQDAMQIFVQMFENGSVPISHDSKKHYRELVGDILGDPLVPSTNITGRISALYDTGNDDIGEYWVMFYGSGFGLEHLLSTIQGKGRREQIESVYLESLVQDPWAASTDLPALVSMGPKSVMFNKWAPPALSWLAGQILAQMRVDGIEHLLDIARKELQGRPQNATVRQILLRLGGL